MKEYCKARVHDPFGVGFHDCTRWAVKDGFCKQHHPDAEKERAEKSRVAYEARQKREPWYLLGEAREKLEAARKEIEWLKEIAIRAGAWQDKNGTWVYGNDKVSAFLIDSLGGPDIVVNNVSTDVAPKDRKCYAFVEKGPGR